MLAQGRGVEILCTYDVKVRQELNWHLRKSLKEKLKLLREKADGSIQE